MKFLAKDIKKLTVIMKRVVTDKKQGVIQLKHNGDGILHVLAENKFMSFYAKISCEGEETFSFRVPLYELDKWLTDNEKKKKDKFEYAVWKINKKSIKENQTAVNIKVEPIEWDEVEKADLLTEAIALPSLFDYQPERSSFIPPSPWRYMENPDQFIRILKEGHDTIKKNEDIRTMFMVVRSGKAMAIEERRANLYRMSEEFPFENLYLHRDVMQVLSSTIKKGVVKHKKSMSGFHLQNDAYLFTIQDSHKTVFPNLRKMVTKKRVFSYTVDAGAVNRLLKTYKKEVTNVVIRFSEGNMHFIPNDESYETSILPISDVAGTTTECKFSTDVLKGLFGSYDEPISIEHLDFRNAKQKDGYLWRIYKPEQLSIATGISRLDWDLLERLHKEGKLSKISSLQELEELNTH